MAGKRRRLVPWKRCCENCTARNAPRQDILEYLSVPSPAEEGVDVDDSLIHIDTHVHINEVFIKMQISAEVPSLGKEWSDMTEGEREAWVVLGFDREKWVPASFVGRPEERQAAWRKCITQYGTLYYYNSGTGEMTWEKPADFEDPAPDDSVNEPKHSEQDVQGAWQVCMTRFGRKYYCNTQTGEMTWDPPSSNGNGDAVSEPSQANEPRDPFQLEWEELSLREREAALALGYTDGTWDQTGTPNIPSLEALRSTLGTFACITTGCDPDGLEQTLFIHKCIPLPPQHVMCGAMPREGFPGFVWASLGCHPKTAALFSLSEPSDAFQQLDAFEERLREVAAEMKERLIAWGEIGLDFSHPLFGSNPFNQWFQQQAFEREIKIGMELHLPLVIHAREAWGETMQILKKVVPRDYPLHLHCMWEPPSAMKELFTSFPRSVVGLTNNVFFPGDVPEQLAQSMPLEHMVLETDAPYLPRTGSYMSHMGDIPSIGRKIAELKGVSFGTVMEAVRQNVNRIYGI